MKKPHLSVTQIEMHGKCQEQYRRRYIERDVIPPGFALVRGSAVHEAAEANMRQKISSRRDLPAQDVVDMAAAAFEHRVQSGVSLNAEEASRGLSVVKGETLDMVARLARLHAVAQAPDYQPVAVEEAVLVTLPAASRDLLCVIDLVDETGTLADFKTSAKAKTQQEADESLQLTTYHFAWQAKTGAVPTSLVLDVAVDKETGQKRQRLETDRTRHDVLALGRRFAAVSAAVDSGVFAPAPVGAWWCSEKFCGYHASCPFVRGSRRQGD